MFEQVAKYFPALMPYLIAIYGRPRNCWTPSLTGPCELILSHEGVAQGHIWGSALFNIGTLEPILLTLNKLLNPQGQPSMGVAYAVHDDVGGVADPVYLATIWPTIVRVFTSVGLTINYGTDKSAVYIPPSVTTLPTSWHPSTFPSALEIRRDGIVMVGTPIGDEAFSVDFWKKELIDPITEAVPRVCQWSDVQAALCLFRLCINHKYNYFLRMTDPATDYIIEKVKDILSQLQLGLLYICQYKVDQTTAEGIMENRDLFTQRTWDQACLPAKMGGLGLIDPQTHHVPAFIASQMACARNLLTLQSAHRSLNEYDISPTTSFPMVASQPTPNQVIACLPNRVKELTEQFLQTHSATEVAPSTSTRLPAQHIPLTLHSLVAKPTRKIQHTLVEARHKSDLVKYRKKYGTAFSNRIDSASAEGAILVTVLPTVKEFRIDAPYVFAERITHRLNIPYLNVPKGNCVCGKPIDHYHILSVCPKGNLRQTKHDAPKNEIAALSRSGGLVTIVESRQIPKMVNIESKEVIDLQFNNYDNGPRSQALRHLSPPFFWGALAYSGA